MSSPGIATVSLARPGGGDVTHSRFYVGMAALLFVIVLGGFARTFYLKPLFGANDVNLPSAYVHGAVMTVWYVMFLVQASLVATGNQQLHRRLGVFAALCGVLAIVTTGFTVLSHLPEQGVVVLDEASLPRSSRFPWGNLGVLITFAGLFSAAIYYRKQPHVHKRLMLFAFIGAITPAVARLTTTLGLPGSVSLRNTIGIAVLMGIVVAHEAFRSQRIHRTTLSAILFISGLRAVFVYIIPSSDFGLAVARAWRTAGSF